MHYVRTEIISSSLEAAAWEMCAALIRTAYSPNIKERADCSTAICDIRGRTLSLATHAPAHLGSTLRLVPALLERFPLESLSPGDIFFANDPYIVGVTHLNDCTVAAPIFFKDRVIGFAAAVAHHSDVGGRVPGSESGDSNSIYQEGVRIPPVKLYAGGELRKDIFELFLLNSRTPHFSQGDILAQTSAMRIGIHRVQQLYEHYGAEVLSDSIRQMLDATELRLRTRIGDTLKIGSYSAADWLDEDGISDQPVKLAVNLTVAPDSVTFDFSECAAQLKSGKNVPLTHTMATVYYCIKAIVDPHLSINEGMYRPIHVIAPEGSVVNPVSPAGVSSRNLTSMILADVMFSALGQAAPSRAIAGAGPYQGVILSGWDPLRERFFVDYENFAGGHGASTLGDGMDVTQSHTANTSNLPIEVMEIEFPVRVEKYEMVPDSGGSGCYRGGNGVVRELRILNDETTLACRSARQRFPAPGLKGGGDGAVGSYILNPGKENEQRLPSTASELRLKRNDLLRIITPGGGGIGDAKERDRNAVQADLRQGKISITTAENQYGFVATPEDALQT